MRNHQTKLIVFSTVLILLTLFVVSFASAQTFTVNQIFPPPGGPSPDGDFKLIPNTPPLSFQFGYNFTDMSFNPPPPLFNCTFYVLNGSNSVLLLNTSQPVYSLNMSPPPFFLDNNFMNTYVKGPMQSGAPFVYFNWSVACYNMTGTLLNTSSNRTINMSSMLEVMSGGSFVGNDGIPFEFSSGPPTPIGNDETDVGPVVGNNMNLSMLAIKDAPGFVMLMMGVAGDRIGRSLSSGQPPDFQSPISQFNGTHKTPFCTNNATLTPETDMQYYLYVDFDGNQLTGCAVNNSEINSGGYDFQIFFNASQPGGIPQFRNCTSRNGNFSIPSNYSVIPNVADIDYTPTCLMAGIAHFRIKTGNFSSFTNLNQPNITEGIGFMGEIGNGSGIMDSFSRRMKYTPGTMDFFPFDPKLCEAVNNSSAINASYAAGHPECNIFGGCPGGDCNMQAGKGFMNNSNFVDCFSSGQPGQSFCVANPNCAFLPVCRLYVNDSSAPSVLSTQKVAFANRVFIDWSTNEPSNGTVQFYKNDSACSTINSTVVESFPPPPPGVPFLGDFKYKPFHHVDLSSNADSLGFALSGDTTYYFKTKSCDKDSNCALSNCLSFVTDSTNSFNAPKFMNFTEPPGVNFQIDTGSGSFSDFNSGNFSSGEDFRMKFGDENSTWAITLIGVDLTAAMAINFNTTSFAVNNSGSTPFVGISEDIWMELVQKLGADTIEITIPDTGNTLLKCNETGESCTDVSSLATLVSQADGKSTWRVPVSLGFSSYSVNASEGFQFVSDQGVYGSYPTYTFGLINMTSSNSSIVGTFNVTINVSSTTSSLSFSFGLNRTNGTSFFSPDSSSDSSARFNNVPIQVGTVLGFRFNVSNTVARADFFNVTVYFLNASGGINGTAYTLSPLQLGAINITTVSGTVFNSSAFNITFIYDSVDDASQLCTLSVDGVVNASNSSAASANLTNLAASF